MKSPLLSDYGFSASEPNQVELQIVYMDENITPSSYVMPDVISVEVQFGADIPPKLIQVTVPSRTHLLIRTLLCPSCLPELCNSRTAPLSGSDCAHQV